MTIPATLTTLQNTASTYPHSYVGCFEFVTAFNR